MGVRQVFEVLYSPVEAFKKIIEKPDFRGVLLVLVLAVFSMLAVQYVATSKFSLETRTPDEDNWTESLADQHNLTSNGFLSLDETDFQTGNTVGNHSVKSSVFNTSIWMKVNDVEPLDCSEDEGFKELFFWIKWTNENGLFPSSGATLRLFSGESRYFESDIISYVSSGEEWRNATLKIGPGQGWDPINSPEWRNITGLEFRLLWSAPANLTMKIDGLYFRKYVPALEAGAFSGAILPILLQAAVIFSMNWILWAGILLMLLRVFREEVTPWTVFFVIIGHVFIATVVYTLASAALFTTLPPINLPLSAEDINALINEMWSTNSAYQAGSYLPLVGEVWIAVLCAIAIRVLRGITWGKALSIAAITFVIRFVLRFFFGV